MITGDTLDAKTAEALGLLNEVVLEGELAKRTEAVANRFVAGPSLAIGRTKYLLNLALQNTLADPLNAEAQLVKLSGQTGDFREGLCAFFEKRKPNFHGN